MTTLEQVAGAILCRVIDAMTVNQADETDMEMAMTICHEQRENPEMLDLIAECTKFADWQTGGTFSAVLQRKQSILQ